jgi:sugar/nucleoside kinase (ribokinase family)
MVIVVIGSPSIVPGDPGRRSTAAGRSIEVAQGVIDGGAPVELVGKIGDDPAGDALLLALADAGIGHVALLRDPARRTPVVPLTMADSEATLFGEDEPEPGPSSGSAAGVIPDEPVPTIDAGDLDLALRYLPDHRVVVVAERLEPDALAVVAADCSYVGAVLVVILEPAGIPPDLPPGATLFEAPDSDPDGLFGRTVGRFVAALDRGTSGAEALAQATADAGWQLIGS